MHSKGMLDGQIQNENLMLPKFDEIIHRIPGVKVTPAATGVYRVHLLGYADDGFYTSKVSCMYNSVRKSWDTFDESKIDEYISGGVWEHDWLRHWMMHLLLCYLGRESEAMEMLRVHAREVCTSISEGLLVDNKESRLTNGVTDNSKPSCG